jgi:WD40 repeat protein
LNIEADVRGLGVSRDGVLAVGTTKGSVSIWNIKTKRRIRTFGTKQPVRALTVSRSGRYVVAGQAGGTLEGWDLRTGNNFELSGHGALVGSVNISPDERLVLSASAQERRIRVWDLRSGKELQNMLVFFLGQQAFLGGHEAVAV